MILTVLLSCTCGAPAIDAQAVFVDHAPSVERTLARIDSGDLSRARALGLLREMYEQQGRRLTPRAATDEDLFIQVDDALRAFVARHGELAEALPPPADDPVQKARAAAASGATASALRWLSEAPAGHPLERLLVEAPSGSTARSTLQLGDEPPDDLIDTPMWHVKRKGARTMPLIVGDMLVLSGPDRIECLDVITGKRVWHRDGLAMDVVSSGLGHGGVHTVDDVPGGDIVAWVGRPVPTGFEGGGRIMKLSSHNGAIRWQFDPATLDDATGSLRPSGPPLVADDAVFIPMRRHGRAMQVESWLLALDLESGHRRWLRYLGTSGASVRGVVWPGDAVMLDTSALVIQTGVGILASLDPRSGDVDWLRRMTPGRWQARSNDAPPSWAVFEPLRIGPHLIALAPDLSALLVINPSNGEIRSSTPALTGSDLGQIHSIHAGAGGSLITHGDEVSRWRIAEDGLLSRLWTWTDTSQAQSAGRMHLTPDQALVPFADRIASLHLEDGRPLWAIPLEGGGHSVSAGGIIVMSSPDSVTVVGGLQSTLARLTRRTQVDPEDAPSHLSIIDLAVRAGRGDLVRTHLPVAMSVAAAALPSQAMATVVAALDILDPAQAEDRALVQAAIDVLADSGSDLARLHLARGDWVEPASTTAAIDSWLAADSIATGGAWDQEAGVHAPVSSLVARRLTRHGLAHAVDWPPPSDHPGANLRAGTGTSSGSRSHALSLISSASGLDAIAIATVAGFDEGRIEAMRNVVSPRLLPEGQPRRLSGAFVDTPGDEGMLLRDGATITWHESLLREPAWQVSIDGAPGDVVSVDTSQIVLVVDQLGGGRLLQSRNRQDGAVLWTLNLNQFAKEIDPPTLIAATQEIAALAGRDRVYLVDLQTGEALDHAPGGWPIDAVAVQDELVLLLDDTAQRRSTLHVVAPDGRVQRWPQPPHLPRASWLDKGPLGGVALGDDGSVAFAPGPGERWWWHADNQGPSTLRGAIVLPEAVITRSASALIDRRDPLTGRLLGAAESPLDRDDAAIVDIVHLGDGLVVVTEEGIRRLDASGALVWADAHQESTPPILATVAGGETLVFHAEDLLRSTLLPTEARTEHHIRRLDPDGRLVDTIDLFPVAGRIRRAESMGGLLCISDNLDTWLIPLPSIPDRSAL